MDQELIQDIEKKFQHFQSVEDSLTPEEKQVMLEEINALILSLNKAVEEYIVAMRHVELGQKS
jgi:hypothetical protein